jgi:hypothetical protein
MTSNLDTQAGDPAAIEATETKEPRMIGILDYADLVAVNGGSVGDGVARAVLSFRLDLAAVEYGAGEFFRRVGPCGYKGP